jgi:hypothetical protein
MILLNSLKPLQKISSKFLKNNIEKTDKDFTLPRDYTVSKFYEFGFKVSHQKSSDTYNSCCPICREGKSWGRKKRAFYIPDQELIYCHNCGWSSKPYKWIREVSGMSDEQLWEEVEKGDFGIIDVLNLDDGVKTERKIPSLPEDSINLFDPIQVSHYKDNDVVQKMISYIKYRRLDTAINRPDAFYVSLKDSTHKNRLIIPFKDDNGKIIFYQSRKVMDWDDKDGYISKVGGDKSLCGMDKIDPYMDSVFLFEGPLDSFFIENGLGLGGINKGSGFTHVQEEQLKELELFEKIWFLDSQWLDKTSRIKTEKLINEGASIFFWPENYGKRFKDLNQMCMTLKIDQISPKFVKENTSRGIAASVKLKMIKS